MDITNISFWAILHGWGEGGGLTEKPAENNQGRDKILDNILYIFSKMVWLYTFKVIKILPYDIN